MSRRGAGTVHEFELIETPALGSVVISLAKELLQSGLTAAEACSLFTQAAVALSQSTGGLSRDEWLDLCEALYDHQAENDYVTSPGGAS